MKVTIEAQRSDAGRLRRLAQRAPTIEVEEWLEGIAAEIERQISEPPPEKFGTVLEVTINSGATYTVVYAGIGPRPSQPWVWASGYRCTTEDLSKDGRTWVVKYTP